MIPKHNNPQELSTGRYGEFWAHAPYNFVPLPEKVVAAEGVPDQDRYSGQSGYIDCTLVTQSPLYTRSAMTAAFFEASGEKSFHELSDEEKVERARFFTIGDPDQPIIPGSGLRGMVRALVEIVSFSKVQPVTNDPLIFRSVGDTTSLGNYYRSRLMHLDGDGYDQGKRFFKYTPLMLAGYVVKDGSQWFIQPAQKIGGTTFARVFKREIPSNLKPWHGTHNAHPIWVKLGAYDYQNVRGGLIKLKFLPVLEVSASKKDGFQEGVLAISGEMDKKAREAVFFPPDTSARSIAISDELLSAYRDQISAEQEVLLGKDGALKHGQPVFYLMEKGRLVFFGHAMMFRLPYSRSPKQFVPDDLQTSKITDLAEAIFGYVPDGKTDKRDARAGRVFFQDARLLPQQTDIWLSDRPITPRILGSPKPTTFQHYLTQQQPDQVPTGKYDKQNNPRMELRLDHYASPPPHETVIRGSKLYWNKGNVSLAAIQEMDQDKVKKAIKQYTLIQPVKAGVRFKFRIYFENLTEVELGALLWVLRLPTGHRQKLGMGKPLGMGAVEITPELHVFDRVSRYTQLLADQQWFGGTPLARNEGDFTQAFEDYVLGHIDPKDRGSAGGLRNVPRLQMLLEMLKWPGPDPKLTQYMTIDPVNEYKERPVLPDPLNIQPPATPHQKPKPGAHGGRPAYSDRR